MKNQKNVLAFTDYKPTDYADKLLSRQDLHFKRFLDILLSLGLLIITSPLFLVFACLIKLSSPGPIFYWAIRLGKNQKPFYMLKFRTMIKGADKKINADPELKRRFEIKYKLQNDSRVTPLGAWLRRTGLDELPQLFNVLWGEMSIVGPRPILKNELARTHVWERFTVPPGLTGLWQIMGKNALSYEQKNELDWYYCRHRTWKMDMKILLETLPAIIKGYGFY